MPIQKHWYLLYPGRCLDQRALQLASAIINLISDLVILCLPIATVWTLDMERLVAVWMVSESNISNSIKL